MKLANFHIQKKVRRFERLVECIKEAENMELEERIGILIVIYIATIKKIIN